MEITLIAALLGTAIYITVQKVQRWREENSPEGRRLQQLLLDVEAWLHLRELTEPSEAEQAAGARLDPTLARHLEQAAKLLVLCEAGQHTELREHGPGTCAAFLVRTDHQQVRLAASHNLERVARFARDMGRLLALPVEMV